MAQVPVVAATTAVSILSPLWGTTFAAREHGTRRLAVPLSVSGTALGRRVVVVDGGCAARRCLLKARVSATGRWFARLLLDVPSHARRWTVTARYDGEGRSVGAARVMIAVRPPSRPTPAPVLTPTTTAPPVTSTPGPATPPTGAVPDLSLPAGSVGNGALVLIGDSLSEGQRPLLEHELPGWTVRTSSRIGRPLAEGMQILAATTLPRGTVLAMGLFTNDDPWRTAELQAAVRTTLTRVGPTGCVIWATIASPPVSGQTFATANALLTKLTGADSRLQLVPWAAEVAAYPQLLAGDGVHPTPAGERIRAQLFARAAAACSA